MLGLLPRGQGTLGRCLGQGLPVLTQPAASTPLWDPDYRSTKSKDMHRVGQPSPAEYTRLPESEQEHEVKGPEQGGKGQNTGAGEP